jgi:hypothetical protein
MRRGFALLFAAGLASACSPKAPRTVEPDEVISVESEARAECADAEGFDSMVRRPRVEALSVQAQNASPEFGMWWKRVERGLEEARRAHAQSWAKGCSEAGEEPVALTRVRACLERAVIRLDAELGVLAERLEEKPDSFVDAQSWSWSLGMPFEACASSAHREGSPPLAGAQLETQARLVLEQLEGAWAWARLGEYPRAERELSAFEEKVRSAGDPPSVFSAHLLRGYLALARGELAEAEAQLAPASALAKPLGASAKLSLAFFRGTAATVAGDDRRAEASFEDAQRLAGLMSDEGARSYELEAAEAELRAAQARWRMGESDALSSAQSAWKRAAVQLEPEDPRRAEYLEAVEQMGGAS